VRRLLLLLVLGSVFALFVVTTATAAPPNSDWCGPDGTKPDHPSCADVTTTTEAPEPPTLQACPSGTFRIGYQPGTTRFECDWILPAEAPEGVEYIGGITALLVEGQVRTFTVMVRDSSPGDLCELSWDGKTPGDWEWYEGQLTADGLDLTFPLSDDRGTYWDFVYVDNDGATQLSSGEHWCGPYDPIEGLRAELNGDPLHLALTMRAARGTVVEVALDPVRVQE
jgi:hypothetical protein